MIKKYYNGREIKSTKKMTKGCYSGWIKIIFKGAPGVPGPKLFVSEAQYAVGVKHTYVARENVDTTTAAK